MHVTFRVLVDSQRPQRLDDRAPSVHRGLGLTAQTALLRRLCLKLAVRHDRLPSSFYVSGVICMSKEPIDSGAFADIYQGEYRGGIVILKRPRIPSEENRPKVMTVSIQYHKFNLPTDNE